MKKLALISLACAICLSSFAVPPKPKPKAHHKHHHSALYVAKRRFHLRHKIKTPAALKLPHHKHH